MAVDNNYHHFPSFFKIILEPKDPHKKMGIPNKFMIDYGSDLSKVVTLRTPTGYTRKVELVKEANGKTLLGNGWPEFVEYNAICHGYFLVFAYATNSLFYVNIFDMTACEIEYPLPPQQTNQFKKEMIQVKSSKRASCTPTSSLKGKEMVALVKQYMRKSPILTIGNIRKINSTKFENPSFATVMQPSYVNFYFRLNIPAMFARENMKKTKGRRMILENTKGFTWHVNCVGKKDHNIKIVSGWKDFALDNNLHVGDICVFMLINHRIFLFNVEIIRCSSDNVIVIED